MMLVNIYVKDLRYVPFELVEVFPKPGLKLVYQLRRDSDFLTLKSQEKKGLFEIYTVESDPYIKAAKEIFNGTYQGTKVVEKIVELNKDKKDKDVIEFNKDAIVLISSSESSSYSKKQ